MGDNLKIKTFRENLVHLMNTAELPIEVIRMVLKEALEVATEQAEITIQKEIEQLVKENENE